MKGKGIHEMLRVGGYAVNKSGTAEDIHAFVSCSFLPGMKAFFLFWHIKQEVFL